MRSGTSGSAAALVGGLDRVLGGGDATAASSRKKPRRLLLIARTIRIVVPSTDTPCPASRAERGTFSSASPGRQRTSSASPGAIRSSSSFVRTHVIGHVSAVMSSVRAAIEPYRSGRARARLAGAGC